MFPADFRDVDRYNENINENIDVNAIAEERNDMPKTTQVTTGESQPNPEMLESLLDDLDLGAASSEPIEEDVVVEEDVVIEDGPAAELDDEELRTLEADITRTEAYAAQTSKGDVDPNAPEEAKKNGKAAKANAAPKAAKTAGTPRAPRDLSALDEAHFELEDGVAADKAAVMASVPKQKKIAEKFENLFGAIAAGRKPSVFVTTAFALLDAKTTITSTDIVNAYKSGSDPYSEGTARSQAGQIMHLFDTVKIATRSKQTLTLNAKSTVAAKLRKIMAGA